MSKSNIQLELCVGSRLDGIYNIRGYIITYSDEEVSKCPV